MVSTTLSITRIAGNDSAVDFSFYFPITSEDQLEVKIADANDENRATLVLNTNYTVAGVGEDNGGSITLDDLTAYCGQATLPTGWNGSIRRVPILKQLTRFEKGAFNPATYENSFDFCMMVSQYLQEQINRCPKVSTTSGLDGDDYLDDIEDAVSDAQTAQTAAETAQTAAETAQTAAETAQTGAETAETNAATSAADAASYVGLLQQAVPNIKTDDYTLADADRGKLNIMNAGTAKAFTLPAGTDGWVFMVKNIGAGTLTLTPNGAETTEIATIEQDEGYIMAYDNADTKWRAMASIGSTVSSTFELSIMNIKTDDYTLQAADKGKLNIMDNAAAKAFTLPAGTEGDVFMLKSIGAGTTTITPNGAETTEVATLEKEGVVILAYDNTNTKWRAISKTSTFVSAARAYLSGGDQTLAASTSTKITLDAESYDENGDFASNDFTAPVDGVYSANANILFNAPNDGIRLEAAIKNSAGTTTYAAKQNTAAGTNADSVEVSDSIKLDKGDTLSLWGQHTSGGTKDVSTGAANTYLSVVLIKEL